MGNRNRSRTFALCAGVLLAVWAGAPVAEASRTLDRIKAGGTMHLGYRAGAAPFSFADRDGRVRGYSVELCARVAASIQSRLGLKELKTEWTALGAADRLEAVATGKVDIECGTTTITLSRQEKVDFSVPIFVDGASVIVAADSKLTRLADLNGRKVAVIPGTTTESALARALKASDSQAQLVPVKSGVEGVRMVSSGKADGYAGDRIVLIAQRAASVEPERLQIIDSDFSFEPYALVVARDDPDFRLEVNRALVELYRSGDIDLIFYRWLGGLGRPTPLLHAMFYLNTLPE